MGREVKLRGARHCFNYTLPVPRAFNHDLFLNGSFQKSWGENRQLETLVVIRVPDLQLHGETQLEHKIHEGKENGDRLAGPAGSVRTGGRAGRAGVS